MNRLMRVILYIVAGCVGLGCALLIMGAVLGGDDLDLNSDADVQRARHVVADRLEERWNMLGRWLDGRFVSVSESVGSSAADQRFPLSEVEKISVNLKKASLDVAESSDDQIRVQVNNGDGIVVECKNGMLSVTDKRTGTFARKEAEITMELPKERFAHIALSVDAGVLSLDQRMVADTIVLNADAGEIDAVCLETDHLEAKVGVGSICVDEGFFGTVSLDCGMGDLEVGCAQITGNSTISCGMGDVDLELSNGIESANYEVSCGMGNIDIGDSSYSGLSRTQSVSNGADHTISLDCGMGNIEIYD